MLVSFKLLMNLFVKFNQKPAKCERKNARPNKEKRIIRCKPGFVGPTGFVGLQTHG